MPDELKMVSCDDYTSKDVIVLLDGVKLSCVLEAVAGDPGYVKMQELQGDQIITLTKTGKVEFCRRV